MPIGLLARLARAAAALGSCAAVGPALGEVCPSDGAVAKRGPGGGALAPPMGAGKFSPSPFDSPLHLDAGVRMPGRLAGAALLSLTLAGAARAQGPDSTSLASPFRALDLPAPNEFRTGAGRPGAGYWQQRADYRIAATLDPATQELR